MKKLTPWDRLLLLLTSLLAAYQIMFGITGLNPIPMLAYTVSFGVLLVAGLLILIIGFEILDTPSVVVIASLIPLAFSTGLVAEHLPRLTGLYLTLTAAGFSVIVFTRLSRTGKTGVYILALIHGISGLMIFILPLYLSLHGRTPGRFMFISVGGGLIGMGGIFLAFLKTGRPVLGQRSLFSLLPGLLFVMTVCFVIGLSAA